MERYYTISIFYDTDMRITINNVSVEKLNSFRDDIYKGSEKFLYLPGGPVSAIVNKDLIRVIEIESL